MSEGRFARIRSGVTERWMRLRDRRPSVRHVIRAWQHLQENNGMQYAAAITFFSFLALFPLLLLAVSITGFVLHSDPGVERSFLLHVTDNVPGALGETLKTSLQAAIDSRTSLGIVGLFGVLFTGLGWIGNLRKAIDAVWSRTPDKLNFVKEKLANLVVLAGLGLGAVVSIGLTVIGTSLTDQILGWLGLDSVPGAGVMLKLLGIALAVAGDTVIFWWLLVRLPQIEVPTRIAVKGALLAAIGFEVLKILGSFTIAHTANSPTAGPFAGIIAVLIWIQLVARWMLFACAWTAVLNAEHSDANAADVKVAEPPAPEVRVVEAEPVSDVSPAAVGATLVGAGMIAGAAATWALTRPHQGE
jgi:membrane protein